MAFFAQGNTLFDSSLLFHFKCKHMISAARTVVVAVVDWSYEECFVREDDEFVKVKLQLPTDWPLLIQTFSRPAGLHFRRKLADK